MDKIYPYYGATSLMDYVDNFLFNGIYLLLGEDGTVIDDFGFPILQYIWGKFWVNNHAHILQGKNGFTVESLYILLKSTNVTSIVTGAVQLKINQGNLKSINVYIPSDDELASFNETIAPLFERLRNSADEISKLSILRDSLLPKLVVQ
jgi:type I restriction enzyme S subunit